MAGVRYSRAKELSLIVRTLPSFSAGQARVLRYDDEQLEWVDVEITPVDGVYRNGSFIFKIIMEQMPTRPLVKCLTKIYHPNIEADDSGNVCLSLLSDWQPHMSLQDLVQGLMFLLYNPNLEDPLAGYVTDDQADYERLARELINGTYENNDDNQFDLAGEWPTNDGDVKNYYSSFLGGASAPDLPTNDMFVTQTASVMDKAWADLSFKTCDHVVENGRCTCYLRRAYLKRPRSGQDQPSMSKSYSFHGLSEYVEDVIPPKRPVLQRCHTNLPTAGVECLTFGNQS